MSLPPQMHTVHHSTPGLLQEFKEFALKGNMIDLTVGLILGSAFSGIIQSMVQKLLLPSVRGLMPAPPEGGSDALGFAGSLVEFLMISLVIFLIVRVVSRMKKGEEPEPVRKECPYCYFSIPIEATRCGHCTSELATTEVETTA